MHLVGSVSWYVHQVAVVVIMYLYYCCMLPQSLPQGLHHFTSRYYYLLRQRGDRATSRPCRPSAVRGLRWSLTFPTTLPSFKLTQQCPGLTLSRLTSVTYFQNKKQQLDIVYKLYRMCSRHCLHAVSHLLASLRQRAAAEVEV